MTWRRITVLVLALTGSPNVGLVADVTNGFVQVQFDNVLVQAQEVPLQAAFTATPTSGQVPLTVQFDASASTGSNLTYEWDFGDGATGEEQQVSHTYNTPGVYLSTLTIMRGMSTSEVRQIIVVQSLQQDGFYTVTPGQPVVTTDGLAFVTAADYATGPSRIKIAVTTEYPELPIIPDRERIASGYYKIFSPDIAQVTNANTEDGYWLGIPVPEGINPRKVEAYFYTIFDHEMCLESGPDVVGGCFDKGWDRDSFGFYYPPTNMYYARISINASETPDFVVLTERSSENYSNEARDSLPWDKDIQNTTPATIFKQDANSTSNE